MSSASRQADLKGLTSKQYSQFKNINKCYDLKQYKKGLKLAEGILSKVPNHGETLAMKGLILSALERKEEALEFLKLGIRNDIRSHVCWHAYGLHHRRECNYDQAAKCYLNALRIDPENRAILRDFALLQIQICDFDGLVETRRKLTATQSENRSNWIGFAVATHLAGMHDTAVSIIDAFTATQPKDRKLGHEDSELQMFRNDLLVAAGRTEEALEHADAADARKEIRDRIALRQRRAELLAVLERWPEAVAEWKYLLARNPENFAYHLGLQCAMLQRPVPAPRPGVRRSPSWTLADEAGEALSAEERARLSDLYDGLRAAQPRCRAHRRTALLLQQGDGAAFEAGLAAEMARGVARGTVALWPEIKGLIGAPSDPRFAAAERAATALVESLRSGGTLPDGSPAPPTAFPWACLLLGRLHTAAGRHADALAALDAGIAHTGTLHDLFLARADALAAAGDAAAAVAVSDHARRLDLADRFLNVSACEHMLLANRVPAAEQTLALFTRKSEMTPQQHVREYQVLWFSTHEARGHERAGNLPMAVKRYREAMTQFAGFVDDQFDFHMYCLRKTTLRTYVDMVRNGPHMREHRFFALSVAGLIRCYLRLWASPPEREEDPAEVEAKLATMSAKEKKKYKAKLRKQRKRFEEERAREEELKQQERLEEERARQQNSIPGMRRPKTDPDPRARTVLTQDFLAEAVKAADEALRFCAGDAAALCAAADAYITARKWLLALRALHLAARATADGARHPAVAWRAVVLAHRLGAAVEATGPETVPAMEDTAARDAAPALRPPALEAARAEAAALLGGAAPAEVAAEMAARAEAEEATVADRVSAARALLGAGVDGAAERARALLGTAAGAAATVEDLTEAGTVLATLPGWSADDAEGFRRAAAARMPMAVAFGAESAETAVKEAFASLELVAAPGV